MIFPNSLYDTLISKEDKYKKWKSQISVSQEHRCKNLKQTFSKLNSVINKKRKIHHDQVDFMSEMQDWVNIHKKVNVMLMFGRNQHNIVKQLSFN